MGLDSKVVGRHVQNGQVSSTALAKQFKTGDKPIMQARDLLDEAPDLAARSPCTVPAG